MGALARKGADLGKLADGKANKGRADATINSQATGAMSWAFITALTQNPQQSYVELLNSIRDLLEAEYSQRPQLSSSHPIGKPVHTPFFLSCTPRCRGAKEES